MNKSIFRAAFALLAIAVIFSCETFDAANQPDEKIIEKGTMVWNDQGPSAARYYWSRIRDDKTRNTYTGYIDRYDRTVSDLDSVVAKPPVKEPAYLAAYETLNKSYSSLPGGLKIPPETSQRMTKMAAGRGAALLASNKVTSARELLKSAVALYGENPELSHLLTEAEVLSAVRKTELEADSLAEEARVNENFYEKIGTYERAVSTVAKAEGELNDKAAAARIQDSPSVTAGASRLKKKRQDVKLEMDRKLRERQYSFKDRIGEEFARVPEGNKLGSMSLEEILAFQEGIKVNVEAAYAEMKEFSEKFPAVIDKAMLRAVEDQKKVLESKIAQVSAEIRTAKDIASRGKTVMPVMIGLFNPVPGGKAGDQKSRPAKFRGTLGANPDYWWGMVSIPKETLNDLVITANDDRQIRVFAENTKSGTLIGGLKDLVNRGYKVGNSWPVLNAGNQLPSGNYFMEIQKGKKPEYDGEAVIYSSFIMRMR